MQRTQATPQPRLEAQAADVTVADPPYTAVAIN